MDSNSKKESGVFINGKAQIIEMLQIMPEEEKATLFKNIQMRNPQLAAELIEKSISFNDLYKLNDFDLKTLTRSVHSGVFGVAIRASSVEFQKRVLSLLPREYAEKAYHAMKANLSNENDSIKKAREKVVQTIGTLNRRQQIKLN
ncbi:FliG C-terminal domain-containing protein [Halobacteriovorax sp. HLS]|uniref:FliG C-terminal domain-containing protein n=1 Tax=Halobacteriovorax sp. HLS TaxID=2234000 RepID=UPI000FD7465E|nr:FliG C-terminal domain-containing protein [Halobacteriovorax sp. HLS]